MGNLIKQMKESIAKSGTSKKDIIFFPADSVHRIRFLQELDDGEEFLFHSDFNAGINALCTDPEDNEDCEYCRDGVKLQANFIWSVWDYDSSSVKLLKFKASGVSPVPALIEMYEEFGTIMDRDYKIKKVGKGTGSSFVVTPMDKEKFTNKKAKPYNRKEMEKLLLAAFNTKVEGSDESDDEAEPEEKVTKKAKKAKKSFKNKLFEMGLDELKEIAKELGMSKKELRNYDDEEELAEELLDSFEEEDIKDVYDELNEESDEDE